MKQTLLAALTALSFITPSPAQSLEKGSMVLGLGSGLGIYHTVIKDKTTPSNSADKDTSGAFVFPLEFEYALLNWLGAGARLGYSNFIEGKKDSDVVSAKARGIDFMPFVNLHFLRSKHVDMFVSCNFGYSDFKFTVTNTAGTIGTFTGSGTGYSVGFNTRFYFGDAAKFGIHVRYAREGFNYQNGEITDNQGSPPTKFSLKGNGGVFGLGLQYRI